MSVLLLIAAAVASEVTEMPPALRADVELDYAFGFETNALTEAGHDTGRRRVFSHEVMLHGEFSPLEDVSIRLAFPITAAWQQRWSDAAQMTYDPVTRTGTYVGGEPLATPPELDASGLQGIWLGVAYAPFSMSHSDGQRADYRLDAAIRLPVGTSFWSAPRGSRGVNPGGVGGQLAAAFSTRRGPAFPYARFEAQLEAPSTRDIVDEAGVTWISEATVKPSSQIEALAGVELESGYEPEIGARTAMDLYLGVAYRTPADIPSGVWLPAVLEQSRSMIVTEDEHLVGRAGTAFVWDIREFIGLRIGVELIGRTPHRVESPYDVWTSEDVGVTSSLAIEGRIR